MKCLFTYGGIAYDLSIGVSFIDTQNSLCWDHNGSSVQPSEQLCFQRYFHLSFFHDCRIIAIDGSVKTL